MSPSVEASELIKAIASPAPAGLHIEILIRGVANRLGLGIRRAKAIWYAESRTINSEEMDRLREAYDKQHGEANDARAHRRRIEERRERLRRRVAEERAHAHGRMVDAAVGPIDRPSGTDRAVD